MFSLTPFRRISIRSLTTSSNNYMPYKPEERPQLTPHQKKLYPQVEQTFTEEGYPVLKLEPNKRVVFDERPKRASRRSRFNFRIRELNMKEDQDWPSIWPTAKTFVPSAVPLPLRQSFEEIATSVPRYKYANTELVKVINFLHLTPDAIKRQCEALKKFCVPWPEKLDTDEQVRKHYPVTYITRDYVAASTSIRDPRARIVQIRMYVKDLNLNARDEDKLKQLAAHRYNNETDELVIQASDCPLKVQNKDYAEYLLTALYYESKIHQKWEDERPVEKVECEDIDAYRAIVEAKLGFNASLSSAN